MKKVSPMHNSIHIVGYFDCIDLRSITAQSEFLREQMQEHKLKHMEALLYTNSAETRFRLILNINGMPFLCTPEIDERTNYSLYLRISETLAELSGARIEAKLLDLHSNIRQRAERYNTRHADELEQKSA